MKRTNAGLNTWTIQKKRIVSAIVVIVLFVVFCCAAYGYFSHSLTSSGNTIAAGAYTVTLLIEDSEGTVLAQNEVTGIGSIKLSVAADTSADRMLSARIISASESKLCLNCSLQSTCGFVNQTSPYEAVMQSGEWLYLDDEFLVAQGASASFELRTAYKNQTIKSADSADDLLAVSNGDVIYLNQDISTTNDLIFNNLFPIIELNGFTLSAPSCTVSAPSNDVVTSFYAIHGTLDIPDGITPQGDGITVVIDTE